MIYIVALGVGFKCPRKIHLNTQCGASPGTHPTLETNKQTVMHHNGGNNLKSDNRVGPNNRVSTNICKNLISVKAIF